MALNINERAVFSAPNLGRPPNTPPNPKVSSTRPFSADPYLIEAHEAYVQLVKEMKDSFVGPMPVDAFFSAFMTPAATMPTFKPYSKKVKTFVIDLKRLEKPKVNNPEEIFVSLVQLLHILHSAHLLVSSYAMVQIDAIETSGLCPNLWFVDTHTKGDQTVHLERKPDISTQVKEDDDETKPRGVIPWRKNELTFERKDDSEDPFQDSAPDAEKPLHDYPFYDTLSAKREHSMGQIISYSISLRQSQHRTHCFSVLWLKSGLRFIRWDRAGAVVSVLVDFSKHGRLIAEFLHRYNHLSPAERGHDPTVTKPSLEDRDAAWDMLRGVMGERPAPKREYLAQFEVQDDSDEEEHGPRYYIAGDPRSMAQSPTGRGTHGYFAYDVQERRVVYLKDTWRIDNPFFEKEGVTYRHLHAHGVPHIATLLCAGDVHGQATRTQEYASKEWCFRTVGIHRFQHYRLVLKEVGKDLSEYDDARMLAIVIRDAVIGEQSTD